MERDSSDTIAALVKYGFERTGEKMIRLIPMTESEFEVFIEKSIRSMWLKTWQQATGLREMR